MECANCKAKWEGYGNMVASISVERIGDEHSYTYWLCPDCDMYTECRWVDQFLGPDEAMKPGVLDRKKGDAIVALIKTCPDRANWKRCECKAHVKLA